MSLFVLYSVVSILGCLNDQPSPSTRARPVVAQQPRQTHSRQARWANQPLYERPAPGDLERFERLIQSAPRTQETAPPLSDPRLRELITAGQGLLRTQTPLEGAWHWTEVRAMAIEGFGTRYPLLQGNHPSLAWSTWHQAVLANPRMVTEGADDEITSVFLFHEATHAVFSQLILATCAFTPREWLRIINECTDVAYEDAFTQETLAHLNEERWAHRVSPLVNAQIYQAQTIARGHQPGYFAREMDEYVGGLSNGPRCGPPVIVRGARRGEYCLPAVIANDPLLLMVVNARN